MTAQPSRRFGEGFEERTRNSSRVVRDRVLIKRLIVVLSCAVAAVAAWPAAASGHGNPLSEAISANSVAFPVGTPPSTATADKLRAAVDDARQAGTPLRVAIVGSPADLGDSTNLFGYPEETATYLGRDLLSHGITSSTGTPEPILVVMPDGMGAAGLSPPSTRAVRQIELPASPTPDDLTSAGGYGVQEVMRALGRPIDARFDKPSVAGGGGGALVPVLVVLGLLALVGLLIVVRVRAGTAAESGA